nr:cache domain-containing protein [Oleiphilaceae bacterium]
MVRKWFGSLVNRAVALVVVFVATSAVVIAAIGWLLSRAELEDMAYGQVETIAGMVARELDLKLSERLDVLTLVAEGFPSTEIVLENRARVLLRNQDALLQLFDATFILDADGRLLAASPASYYVPGFNASQRPYFTDLVSRMSPIISAPYITVIDEQPGVMVAAPLFDANQRFIGMIGGLILLQGDNFMSEFADVSVGQTGYLRLITHNGIVLADGLSGEVMVPVSKSSPSLLQAMSGFEGTSHDNPGRKTGTITGYAQMALVPWFVAAVWPEREAFAPALRMTGGFSWALLAVVSILAPLAFWIFYRLLAPLRNLGVQIYQRHT